jgi:hypothetical protein
MRKRVPWIRCLRMLSLMLLGYGDPVLLTQ